MAASVSASGSRYAVASGCPDATATAASVLEQGGNIIDAAIAGSAVQCVTSPHLVSIGGDLLCVVKFAGEPQTLALNAVGRAPRRADIDTYRRLGHSLVPARGPLSVQTPGLVMGWHVLHQRWATKPLAALLEPAVQFARNGFKVGGRLAKLSIEHLVNCQREHGWSDVFLSNGRTLLEGELLKQERLAATLDCIRRNGPEGFYRGPIARDIVETVRKLGGLLDLDDFETMTAQFTPALTTRFAGMSVATQPPVSQGVVLLRALSLLERETDKGLARDPEALWPAAAKAFRMAFAERLALLGDGPDARTRAEIVLAGRASAADMRPMHAHTGPETTTLSIVDGEGNGIALINSVFGDFGSGIVTDEGGILINNRATGFFLDPKHPNALVPGKSTMHTLHSVIVSDARGLRMAGGSPGGDLQPQVNLQVLARTLLLGETLEDAVAAPRWHLHPGTHPHQLAAQKTFTVRCEPGVPDGVRDAFAEAGFPTEATPDIGSAKWVSRAPSGKEVRAVADRRRDGAVAAH